MWQISPRPQSLITIIIIVVTLYMITIDDEGVVLKEWQPREGWEESFIKAGSLTDHSTIIPNFSNNFDDEEWAW